jgi:squalene synthase HpnC
MVDLAAAYASCVRDARLHYENFPVASLLLPPDMRPHVAAVYAFARAADDFADEGERPIQDRLGLLDTWLARLRGAVPGGEAPANDQPPPGPGEPSNTREIFMALGATARARRIPRALFEDLLSAFRQDVTTTRYQTWPELADYCRRSANPVGRVVLRIGGYQDDGLDRMSDSICTALQLTNFWQDLKIDYDRGRVYLPIEEMRSHGADERALAEGRLTPSWERALAAAVGRTRELFLAGRPLCDLVRGRLRYELRATWLGGMRILSRLESARFDAVGSRPVLGLLDAPGLAAALLAWPLTGRSDRRTDSPGR